MPNEFLASVVFYRGLTIPVAAERDTEEKRNYSMIAANPSRISKTFNEQALPCFNNIAEETKWL